MRLAELLEARVVDVDGVDLGAVKDVRLVQDGPRLEGFGAALRLDALIVGRGSRAVRLGYHRHAVQGPVLLKAVFRALEKRAHVVPWRDVADWHDGVVRLRSPVTSLPRVSDVY